MDSNDQRRTQDLFEQHGRFVFRVVRRLGAPARDVEDLTQEVFIVAHRLMGSFDGESPKGWLFRIATRVVADYRRRASTRREVLGHAGPEEATKSVDGQERALWSTQIRAALDDALDTLSDDERAIFLLHELEELPMRECVALIGCPQQTGYSRAKTARGKMQRYLSAYSKIATSLELRQVV
ncbi:MAG: sigma-70 family RNA polymerase sigma factor [Deltaproteobacteria bacterium]|nr:sigma-70 family RNA polymerase sigma factor [Deltaproteobacteria bacterium]